MFRFKHNLNCVAKVPPQSTSSKLFYRIGRWLTTGTLVLAVGTLTAALPGGVERTLAPDAPTLITQALPLPPPTVQEAPQDNWQIVRVESGQTLGHLFNEVGVPATVMHQVLERPDTAKSLSHLKIGDEIAFNINSEGELRRLRFDRDAKHRVELALENGKIDETVIERETSTRTVVASGVITHSLYAAAVKAGLPSSAIFTLADEIFQYDIDFSRDLKRGDRFSVVMDETWREGERIASTIRAATLHVGGKLYSGLHFEHEGKASYFDSEGRPLQKSFMRMPVKFSRISSPFGMRRHPVMGTMRMHKGVDYAAPTGTPIMAAGDARVQFVGNQRGYGNVVILDHGRGYTTLYGHMSRFANNIQRGQRVKQGAVIGYVGSTGMATGPHLHYEFRVNGEHRNPTAVTMPPPEPISGRALVAFRTQTAPVLAHIQRMEERLYAANDEEVSLYGGSTAAGTH